MKNYSSKLKSRIMMYKKKNKRKRWKKNKEKNYMKI